MSNNTLIAILSIVASVTWLAQDAQADSQSTWRCYEQAFLDKGPEKAETKWALTRASSMQLIAPHTPTGAVTRDLKFICVK